MDRVIFVAALNEEHYIERAVNQLFSQSLRTPVVVVDSASTDSTVKLAERAGADVLEAPRGKLNAVDYAIRALKPNVAILADADSEYPRNWVERLVAPFDDPGILLTSSAVDFEQTGLPWDPYKFLAPWVDAALYATGRHWSGCTAVRSSAYEAAGGYDLSVDQKDLWATWLEEEWLFPARVRKLGRTLIVPDAKVVKSARRMSLAPSDPGFAGKRGLTF